MVWDQPKDDALRAMWSAGVPSTEIAGRLGVTRGVIASRRSRLKLPPRSKETALLTAMYQSNRLKEARKAGSGFDAAQKVVGSSATWAVGDGKPKEKPPQLTALKGSQPRHWFDRAPRQCAWPVAGDGDKTLSCCLPTERAKFPYCEAHLRRMFPTMRAAK